MSVLAGERLATKLLVEEWTDTWNVRSTSGGSKYFQDRGTDFLVLHNVLLVTKYSTHRNIVSIFF